MTRVFLDTNVLIDHFDTKRPNHEFSSSLLKLGGLRKIALVVTPISLINTVYKLLSFDSR